MARLQSFVLLACATAVARAQVVVSNTQLRYDVTGAIVNAHDGCLVQLPTSPQAGSPALYYQYGTVYEDCVQEGPVCDGKCGYLNNTFAVYSTPDLVHWTLENKNVLPALSRDNGHVSYWEANVGFNAATGQYVMLYWSGNYGFVNSSVAVATASLPTGPFAPAPPIVARGASVISDTVALFVDDDGTAYVRYNTIDTPKRHVVEQLTSDWLNTTGRYAAVFEKPDFPWYDGGGMFKRGSLYYVMLSFDCCFCEWGSDALIFVAPSPLGPWTPQNASAELSSNADADCSLSGDWSGVLAGQPVRAPNLHLSQQAGTGDSYSLAVTGAVAVTGSYFPANSSVVFPSFPGYSQGALVGIVGAYGNSSNGCSAITWQNYSPPGSLWCVNPVCGPQPQPPANWTNEVNVCASGLQPPVTVANMNINPCSQFDPDSVFFTVPAQQFNVATLRNASGAVSYLYYGEHFKSAADGLKSHDLQAWIPLSFDAAGRVLPMAWMDNFTAWP